MSVWVIFGRTIESMIAVSPMMSEEANLRALPSNIHSGLSVCNCVCCVRCVYACVNMDTLFNLIKPILGTKKKPNQQKCFWSFVNVILV